MRHEDHPSYKYLKAILNSEDPSMRERMLDKWWGFWVVQQSGTQNVINLSVLTPSQSEQVYELATEAAARELMHKDSVQYKTNNTKCEATIFALRNKPKPANK